MDYRISSNGNKTEVNLAGRLTFDENQQFREIITEIAELGGSQTILDLCNVEFIDSAGLGLLLRIKAEVERVGNAVGMKVSTGGQVKDMIDVAHFEQLIPIISD